MLRNFKKIEILLTKQWLIIIILIFTKSIKIIMNSILLSKTELIYNKKID